MPTKPDVVEKSDAAKEITNAVKDFGWHADPSVANVWPHITVHERWHLAVKNCTRCSRYQSGFNEKCWDHAVIYTGIALSITKKAPILDWERDPSRPGGLKEYAGRKLHQTCWEAHHGGKEFTGPAFATRFKNGA